MFELNNLGVYVGSPVQAWLQALKALPEPQRRDANTAAAPWLEALPEELPGCEGNAFYALHRWGGVQQWLGGWQRAPMQRGKEAPAAP